MDGVADKGEERLTFFIFTVILHLPEEILHDFIYAITNGGIINPYCTLQHVALNPIDDPFYTKVGMHATSYVFHVGAEAESSPTIFFTLAGVLFDFRFRSVCNNYITGEINNRHLDKRL